MSTVLALYGLAATPAPSESPSRALTVSLRGEPARLTFDPWFAGAVSQLRFRGQSYINAADHGRVIQSALSLDGWGECLNPTEAGSVSDGRQRQTTSVLLKSEVRRSAWHSRTQMAYWMPPGAPHQVNPSDLRVHAQPQPCSSDTARRNATTAQNTTSLSTVVLDKRISVVGPKGDLLRFQVGFELKNRHRQAMFEALTAYLEPRFERFYEVEAGSGNLVAVTPVRATARPLIAATSDGRYAMGMASPSPGDMMIGAFRWPETSKLNCFKSKSSVDAGTHRFECLITVGSLEEVRATMARISTSKPDEHP